MKTIRAIFTTKKLDDPRMREYSFNTEIDVKVGDLLQSPDYHGKLLQVTGVEDEVYSHFSFRTGELRKTGGQSCGQIKTLSDATVIVDESTIAIPEESITGF
ncbi:hypothetical protein SAMN05216357_11036 [Porphyromonadaceae bacterium KH3CP3RA]|nr:hypothetical protein SAMN05216357_11036 [Porphyromonadaceae bacterium KH3CP3RA]